jgi:hypothetical protein
MRQTTFLKPVLEAPPSYDELVETDPARKQQGFHSKDQRNAKMACPRDASHEPLLFRSKTGANAGRLWWKCHSCVNREGKLGQLIGLDVELEPTGLKLVDEQEAAAAASAAKRKKPEQELAERAAPAIVAHGRGLDWVQLHDRVNEIQRLVVEDGERLKRVESLLNALVHASNANAKLADERHRASKLMVGSERAKELFADPRVAAAFSDARLRVIDSGGIGHVGAALTGPDAASAALAGSTAVQRDAQ